MTKEERAVKAKRGIWKFSWVVVGLLVVILAGVLMAFMTCRRRTQEPFRERQATSEPQQIHLASPDAEIRTKKIAHLCGSLSAML